MSETLTKDPDARLDYTVDWAAFLTSVADTAVTFEWIDAPTGDLTLSGESSTATTHTIMIAGGALHRVYRLTSRVTTTAGRIQDQSFFLAIQET